MGQMLFWSFKWSYLTLNSLYGLNFQIKVIFKIIIIIVIIVVVILWRVKKKEESLIECVSRSLYFLANITHFVLQNERVFYLNQME